MKFFVARRKFQVNFQITTFFLFNFSSKIKEARKPSDMTELVKQTAEDNQALMVKLKDLQRR
jgi:hypothetical protein